MKRSGPPARRTPLAPGDKPLKRTPLLPHVPPESARSAALRRHSPLRESALARSTAGMSRGRWARKPAAANVPAASQRANQAALSPAVVPFKARKAASRHRCFRCRRKADAWHHWVGQTHLRAFVLSMRMATEPAQSLLRALLRDERNLSPVCAVCHEVGEGQREVLRASQGRFSRDEVPESAGVFAMELDDELEAAGAPRGAVERLLRAWRPL